MTSAKKSHESHHIHSHLVWLDWCRFLAAFVVLLVHTRGSTFVEFGALPADQRSVFVAAAYALTRIGNEAVVVFFVLSGILVGGKAVERMAAGTFRPLEYSLDRMTRILLPLLPTIILTAAVAGMTAQDLNWWHCLGTLCSLQGVCVPPFGRNMPLWSLAYEVWFYVATGTLGLVVTTRRLRFTTGATMLAVCMVFTELNVVYLFCWLIGAMTYLYRPNKLSLFGLSGSFVVMVIGVIGAQLAEKSVSVSISTIGALMPSKQISQILLAGGFAVLAQQITLMRPISLSGQRIEALGTGLASFSYTLYLTHYPILQAMSHFGLQRAESIDVRSLVMYLAKVVGCLLCAWVLYLAFESHTSEVRKWVKKRAARFVANTPMVRTDRCNDHVGASV